VLTSSTIPNHFPDLFSAIENPILLSNEIKGIVYAQMTFCLVGVSNQHGNGWMGGGKDYLMLCFKIEI
jgi:hypothetical protein